MMYIYKIQLNVPRIYKIWIKLWSKEMFEDIYLNIIKNKYE
jgi:hypothetical protein